jgi:Rrf2 family protein
VLKLTKKSDYGLMALRHLATAGHDACATAKEMSDAYKMPLPMLSKVLQTLARNGLLAAEQGARGGYRLAKSADLMTVLEVARAIDGPVILTPCLTQGHDCDQLETCTVKAPLSRVHQEILKLLDSITVADLSRDLRRMPIRLYNLDAAPAAQGTLHDSV